MCGSEWVKIHGGGFYEGIILDSSKISLSNYMVVTSAADMKRRFKAAVEQARAGVFEAARPDLTRERRKPATIEGQGAGGFQLRPRPKNNNKL